MKLNLVGALPSLALVTIAALPLMAVPIVIPGHNFAVDTNALTLGDILMLKQHVGDDLRQILDTALQEQDYRHPQDELTPHEEAVGMGALQENRENPENAFLYWRRSREMLIDPDNHPQILRIWATWEPLLRELGPDFNERFRQAEVVHNERIRQYREETAEQPDTVLVNKKRARVELNQHDIANDNNADPSEDRTPTVLTQPLLPARISFDVLPPASPFFFKSDSSQPF